MASYIGNPPGTLHQFAGGSAPDGFLMCDGSAVSRSTYSVLWTTIGTAYGAGDGSTTFNLPDLRGRIPVGVGSHTDVDALGKNDGSTLADRRPKHKHTVVNPTVNSHSHGGGNHRHEMYGANTGGSDPQNYPLNPANNPQGYYNMFTVNSGSIITPEAPGTSGGTVGPQANVPTDGAAYVTVNYIIKT